MQENFQGVRMATPADEQAIFKMLCLAQKENGIFPMNERKVRDFIIQATDHKGAIIGVIDGKQGIEATVGLIIENWWYTDKWSLGERWNFVHPNYRKTTHAKRLIEFSKWVAYEMNLDLLMGVISDERTEAKVRLYRRQIPYIGAFFMYKTR